MNRFDDIRPYRDIEVLSVIAINCCNEFIDLLLSDAYLG